jgi:hypothetical protein
MLICSNCAVELGNWKALQSYQFACTSVDRMQDRSMDRCMLGLHIWVDIGAKNSRHCKHHATAKTCYLCPFVIGMQQMPRMFESLGFLEQLLCLLIRTSVTQPSAKVVYSWKDQKLLPICPVNPEHHALGHVASSLLSVCLFALVLSCRRVAVPVALLGMGMVNIYLLLLLRFRLLLRMEAPFVFL